MKFLRFFFQLIRLPIDFLLLTFHYIKGVTWLVYTLLKLKLVVGKQTSPAQYFSREKATRKHGSLPGWPFGCFTKQTSAGRSACLPGRKYGNLFLFRALCPDTERGRDSAPCDTCCLERIQISQFYWRPPLGRIFGVGLFLTMLWSTLGYGVYQLLPTTQKMKQKKAESYFAKGQEFASQKKYNQARLAYENAIKQEPKNANIYFELGKCFFELNRVFEGIEAYKRAVDINPQLWEAHLELARLDMKNGSFQTALQHANSVSKVNSEIAEAYLISAFCLRQQEQPEKAEKALDLGTSKLAKDDAEQTQFAANLYFTMKKLERAKELFDRVLELNPGSSSGRVGLANVLIAQSQLDAAQEQIDQVLAENPKDEKALLSQAELFIVKKEFQEAVYQYQEIIKLYPKAPQPRTRLASILYAAKKKNEAAEILQIVLAEYPNYSDALLLISQVYLDQKRYRLAAANAERVKGVNHQKTLAAQKILARAYVQLKKYEEAIKFSSLVLEAEPKEYFSHLIIAYCNHQLGDKEKAAASYSQAAELNPDSPLPDVYMGTMFSESKDLTPAIDSFRRAQKKAKDDLKIANNLAMLLVERAQGEDVEEAYTIINGLAEQHSDSAQIMDTFGWVLYHKEDYQRAQTAFESAINLDRNLPDAHYHLGKTYLKQNKPELAEKELEKALKLSTSFHGAKDAQELLVGMQDE